MATETTALLGAPSAAPHLPPARIRISGAEARAFALAADFLRQKKQKDARADLAVALENLGMHKEDQEEFLETVAAAIKAVNTSTQKNAFAGVETLMSAVIAGVLIFGTAMTTASQNDPAAKVPNYAGLFATVAMLGGDLLAAYLNSKPFSLERSIIGRVAGIYIALGAIATINAMPDQLGLDKDNPARGTLMAVYGFVMANVSDGVRNLLQQLMGGVPSIYFHKLAREDVVPANFFNSFDCLFYLVSCIVSDFIHGKPQTAAPVTEDLERGVSPASAQGAPSQQDRVSAAHVSNDRTAPSLEAQRSQEIESAPKDASR